jgi:hypothetical protein
LRTSRESVCGIAAPGQKVQNETRRKSGSDHRHMG